MIPLTLTEVAQAVSGRLVDVPDPGAAVTGSVEFDSRQITEGGLFVALVGENADGHSYAAQAVAAGAVAVLAARPVGVPAVVVEDPLVALGRLARAVVDRLDVTVVGVTGSSGKTSTKDLIAQVVSRLGPTVAPPGTFNNELGFPYTVLRADKDTRFLVLEYSARGLGHIDYLCQITAPRIGVVLNVGVAHVGEFGSVDAIAKAKSELVAALPAADGVAILNAGDPAVAAMAPRTAARVVRYGVSPDADVRAEQVTLDERGRPSYQLMTESGVTAVRLGLSGEHQVGNSLAAAAVALECGMSLPDLGNALGELRLVSERRMDVFDTTGGVTVIDDSYNANPGSMAAALRALVSVGQDRRRWAVLGYMAELGAHERAGHEEVGRLAAQLGVDKLVVVEESAAPIVDGAREESDWGGDAVRVADQEAAVEVLRAELRPGDVVLVKGSRYRTWKVADALRSDAAGEERA